MRFFWCTKISQKGVLNHLLWTYPRFRPKISPDSDHKINICNAKQENQTNHIIRPKRSVSSFSSPQGSITAETAFALPIFLFFCIQIISLIGLFQLHSTLEAALHQETAKVSLYAYACDRAGVNIHTGAGGIVTDTVLKSNVIRRAGRDYLDRSMIKGGSSGIQVVYKTAADTQDTVDITLSYRVMPVVDLLGFSGFTMGNRCRMKAWTGYRTQSVSSDLESEELVYITETGTVYHKSRNCSHLMLSVRSVETDALGVIRNDAGGKYYACEHCGMGNGGIVFITEQGNRYHRSLQCSGLKRTVYTVPISETGGRAACSRCSATG